LRDRSKPLLLGHHSTSKDPVWQKPGQSAANFRSSIPARDAQANGARESCAGLIDQSFPLNESGPREPRA